MAEMRIDQLLARIKQGKPIAAIALLGSDSYLRNTCREKLIAAYVPEGMRDWALARFSAVDADWGAVFERAQTMPMLAPRQLVLIEDAEAWEGLDDNSLKALKAYLDDPAAFTVLVFEAAGLDKRRTLYKALAEKALLVELRVDAEAAAALAGEIAAELGADIDDNAATLLADILGAEMARVRNELEKLSLYAAGRRITTADVEALVVAAKKYSVWQLADMLAERRRADALQFLDSVLREGEQPPAVVGALAWMYRKLLEARELSAGVSGWQAAKALGMPPDKAELAIRRARKIPREQLLAGIQALAEADNRLKSGSRNDRAVMEFLVSQLTAGGAPRAA
jgi:DNA polymerase III subunit delta